jgi:hypothetical protein
LNKEPILDGVVLPGGVNPESYPGGGGGGGADESTLRCQALYLDEGDPYSDGEGRSSFGPDLSESSYPASGADESDFRCRPLYLNEGDSYPDGEDKSSFGPDMNDSLCPAVGADISTLPFSAPDLNEAGLYILADESYATGHDGEGGEYEDFLVSSSSSSSFDGGKRDLVPLKGECVLAL